MEKPNQPHNNLLKATSLLLLFLFITITSNSSLSSARPLNINVQHHHHHHNHNHQLRQTEFESESESVFRIIALPSDSLKDIKRPCSSDDHRGMVADSGVPKYPKLAGKYGPLLLNILPKGGVPPSAPGKGTNDVKN
ncbi:hypothetical protein JRO89_XS14G0094300 [Xanthoceras sorbifolium]|uniref:Uncharacterized protein n=1 Tax=Xanthoceras sorbifolium TaxID=99658 RepID=A0ABQ8H4S1_9ROSI|nr:hypothetical protein JRO89_XS14G0094300 [Xanthoceras sorbifolium]